MKKSLPSEPFRKKKMNIGRVVALVCFIFLIVAGMLAAILSYAYAGRAKSYIVDTFNNIRHKKVDTHSIAAQVQDTVTSQVQGQVTNAVGSAAKSLEPGTALSQNGIGDKAITGVKISGKAILITGVLASTPETFAKLELSESGSGQLVATMNFGTEAGQTTATVAKLFTVIPGTYTVKISTKGAWNVTIVEK